MWALFSPLSTILHIMLWELESGVVDVGLTVLILVDQLNVGGTETHVLSLAKHLVKVGLRVIIGTRGGPLLDLFQAAGLEIAYLPFRSDDPLSDEYLELLNKTRELVINEQVDIIHAHFIAGLKIAVQISQELLIPAVATIHGLFYSPRQLRGLIESCPYVIAVSEPVVEWLNKKVDYPLSRIVMIPNGIETDVYTPVVSENTFREELGLRDDEKLILLVSRLEWTKTRVVEVAINAAVELAKDYNLKLAIIGGGANSSLIHAAASLANRVTQQNLVTIFGWRLNTVECYQAADVVIGTARVALEAMSCKRPIIAAGNASYFGILKPDNLGAAWQVYFGDHKWYQPVTVSQLVDDLKILLDNPNSAERIAAQNRKWVVENFTITKIAEKTKEFYQVVLEMGQMAVDAQIPISSGETKTAIEKQTKVVPKKSSSALLLAEKPLVSVAIPAYNTGKFLKDCLDSVAKQTYRPLEIILVNDGSTDNTEEVALAWWEQLENKDNLSFIYQKQVKNTGYAGAQSTAYHLASGDYIANQDSDDLSHPRRIETELFFLLANPNYSLVGCNFNSFKDSLDNQFRSYLLKYGYEQIINTYHDGGHCICFGTLLFNRQVYDRIGGLTNFLKGAEDYEWITRAINQNFYVDNLKQVLYYYRSHEGQISRLNRELRRKLETAGRTSYVIRSEGD